MINAEAEAELDSIRQKIAVLFIENANLKTGGDTEWRFLDCSFIGYSKSFKKILK